MIRVSYEFKVSQTANFTYFFTLASCNKRLSNHASIKSDYLMATLEASCLSFALICSTSILNSEMQVFERTIKSCFLRWTELLHENVKFFFEET